LPADGAAAALSEDNDGTGDDGTTGGTGDVAELLQKMQVQGAQPPQPPSTSSTSQPAPASSTAPASTLSALAAPPPPFSLLTSPINAPDGQPLCPLAACFCLIPAPLLATVLPPGTPEHDLACSVVFAAADAPSTGKQASAGAGADEGMVTASEDVFGNGEATAGGVAKSIFHHVVAREMDPELLRLRTILGSASKAYQQTVQGNSSEPAQQASQDRAKAAMMQAGEAYEESLSRYEGKDIDSVDMRVVDAEVRRRSDSRLKEVEVYGQYERRAVGGRGGGGSGKDGWQGGGKGGGRGGAAVSAGRGWGGKGRGAPTPRGGRGHASQRASRGAPTPRGRGRGGNGGVYRPPGRGDGGGSGGGGGGGGGSGGGLSASAPSYRPPGQQ
jgi:hypothetical protein